MGFIGRYETHDQIGAGSMGSVYRARDIVLDRDVALKILHAGSDLDPELKERFYREGRAGAKLLHPNIAIVYDLGEANGVAYIAMELLNGSDLRRHIEEKRPLSLAQKVEFLAQVCDGLAHAHRHGIVHRDIKPSNIFIQEDRQAKVLDFGIARLPSSKLTLVGRVLGTPNYMAPEQILSRPCDARSDLFSAAIVFFEFLVYAHPFQSTFIPRRIVESAPDSLYERDPLIPRSLEQLLHKALEKAPEDRLQSAEDFAAGLRAVGQELRTGLATTPIIFDTAHKDETIAITGPVRPEEDDSGGWRVAEFVRLLREFDEALVLGQATQARRAINVMRQLEAADGRFTLAIQDCEGRIATVEPETAAPLAATAGPAAAPAPPTTADPPTSPPVERWEATSVMKSGDLWAAEQPVATVPEPVPPPVTPTAANPAANGTATRVVPPPPADRMRPTLNSTTGAAQQQWTSFRTWFSAVPVLHKQIAGLIMVVMMLVAFATVASSIMRVKAEPAIAQAQIQAASADLLEQPKAGSKRLLQLQKGARVNLLKRLTSREQPFARVQFVSAKENSPPGFIRTADLGNWTTSNPLAAWDFVWLFRPPDSATDGETRQFAEDLQQYSQRFPKSPQALVADVERAKRYLKFAANSKAANQPVTERQADLDRANDALSRAADDPSQKQDVARLRQDWQALGAGEPTGTIPPVGEIAATETGTPPSTAAVPVSEENQQKVASLLRRIRSLYADGDFRAVQSLASQGLVLDKNNPELNQYAAKSWREIKELEKIGLPPKK